MASFEAGTNLARLVISAVAGATVGAAAYNAFLSSTQLIALEGVPSSTDEDEDEDEDYRLALSNERDSLPITVSLRSDPRYKEEEAYGWLSGPALQHNLTATTLSGQGKIAIRPLQFYTHDKSECVTLIHLGRSLCGHDGIVHGGLLGTLLDEMLAYVAVSNLPNRTGFTANLNINYRVPVRADQFVMAQSRVQRVEGRKAFAEAKITSADGATTFVEATGLFISPKYEMPKLLS